MQISDKCIIDNWSLEHAGCLLNGQFDSYIFSDISFLQSLGGLSNYINAILLYDDIKFIANSYQTNWYRFSWFVKNTRLYIEPYLPSTDLIDWNSHMSLPDLGAKNYLLTAKYLDADLFISPERAEKVIQYGSPNIDDSFIRTLKKIDEEIKLEQQSFWYDDVKIGIDTNFVFPSLTHYVLSEASNTDDLLTVIMQLKTSNEIKNIKDQIKELTKTTKGTIKLQKEIENLIDRFFEKTKSADNQWSINLNILFLTLTKSFNVNLHKRKSYLTFLKDIVACRAEAFKLKKDVERIFKRKI